jgi:fucose permease
METNNWIQKVVNSTNGMTQVSPSDDLLSKIQQKINLKNKVSPKTVWLVAASIVVLVMINITVLKTKNKDKTQSTTAYLESTLNQSNQLYQ